MSEFDKLKWQREQRAKDGNAYTKKYEKTKKGFLVRTYRNMKSRVTGVQEKKSHLYFGLQILPKEDFYEWSLSDKNFLELFSEWELSGYERKLSPSIDRIDSKKGYFLQNMRWITHSENSRNGSLSRFSKINL